MLRGPVKVEGGDTAVDDGGHTDLAASLHGQAVEQLVAREIVDHPPGRETGLRSHLAWPVQVHGPQATQLGVGHVNHGLVRRQADAIGRDHMRPRAGDAGAVGTRVEHSAMFAALWGSAAVVGEPEATSPVEDDIVGAVEPLAVAGVVDGLDLAAGDIHALNITAGVAGRSRPRNGQAFLLDPGERAAVVGDVDGAVGADGRPIGTAAGFGHRCLVSVGCNPGQHAALDLGQDDRAVVHGDGAFGKAQALGDQFNVHAGSSQTRWRATMPPRPARVQTDPGSDRASAALQNAEDEGELIALAGWMRFTTDL